MDTIVQGGAALLGPLATEGLRLCGMVACILPVGAL